MLALKSKAAPEERQSRYIFRVTKYSLFPRQVYEISPPTKCSALLISDRETKKMVKAIRAFLIFTSRSMLALKYKFLTGLLKWLHYNLLTVMLTLSNALSLLLAEF